MTIIRLGQYLFQDDIFRYDTIDELAIYTFDSCSIFFNRGVVLEKVLTPTKYEILHNKEHVIEKG